jgi:hypothetical protein
VDGRWQIPKGMGKPAGCPPPTSCRASAAAAGRGGRSARWVGPLCGRGFVAGLCTRRANDSCPQSLRLSARPEFAGRDPRRL